MRALVLGVLLLAGCAAPKQYMPAPEAYSNVYDLESFYTRGTEYASMDSGSWFKDASPELKRCIIRGSMRVMPAPVHEAASRFLADKTEANFQAYLAVEEELMDSSIDAKVRPIVDDCKKQYAS